MGIPPSDNRQFVKIDDGAFYVVSTSSTQVNASDLAGQLHALCMSALTIGITLRSAAAQGVGKAADLVAVLNTVAAFSDEKEATDFLSALQAVKDA